MEDKNYLEDITEIKKMMNKSSRFISLSGLSGILAGVYALIGGGYANFIVNQYFKIDYPNYVSAQKLEKQLIIIAISVILASLLTGIYLSMSKSRKLGEKLWDITSKRLLINFSIPLVTGGVLIIIFLQREYYDLIAPTTLLFYGMACINASKYTLGDVRYLGITITIFGLLAVYFYEYVLIFWMLGFGIGHILYGSLMYFKYDRK
jgi:hypothetical protein